MARQMLPDPQSHTMASARLGSGADQKGFRRQAVFSRRDRQPERTAVSRPGGGKGGGAQLYRRPIFRSDGIYSGALP